jgi:ribosome-associated translation inhibitor RaiA
VEATFSEQGTLKTCQLTVKMRREELTARETTQHMYASLDVAVVAVEQQLRDYRRQHPGAVRKYLRGEND